MGFDADFKNLRPEQPVMVGLTNNQVFIPPSAGESMIDNSDGDSYSSSSPEIGHLGNIFDLPGFKPMEGALPTLNISDPMFCPDFEPEVDSLILQAIEAGLWN